MDRKLLSSVVLLMSCAVILSVAAHLFIVFPFDLKITREIQEQQNPVFAGTMQLVSEPGDIRLEALLIGTVMAIFLMRRQRVEALFVLATASAIVLTGVLKVLVSRPRPPSFAANPSTFFWSASTASPVVMYCSMVSFLVSLHFWCGHSSPDTGDGVVIAACGLLIVLIAPSRVYLGPLGK